MKKRRNPGRGREGLGIPPSLSVLIVLSYRNPVPVFPAVCLGSNRTLLLDRFFPLLFLSFLATHSSNIVRISLRSFRNAMSLAVSFCLLRTLLSQPASSNILVSLRRPIAAAMCKAVSPFLFCSETRH